MRFLFLVLMLHQSPNAHSKTWYKIGWVISWWLIIPHTCTPDTNQTLMVAFKLIFSLHNIKKPVVWWMHLWDPLPYYTGQSSSAEHSELYRIHHHCRLGPDEGKATSCFRAVGGNNTAIFRQITSGWAFTLSLKYQFHWAVISMHKTATWIAGSIS